MPVPEIESFCPVSSEHWREWLQDNHEKKQAVWLVCYQKKSGKPSISWRESVEEALCFGWIDSKKQSIDAEKFRQYFSPRKAGGTWSTVNKEIVQKLIGSGRMSEMGMKSIEIAKANGAWNLGFSKSERRRLLLGLVLAKRPETRQKRINEIAGE